MPKYYLAGPITGYPDGNKPLFDRAAKILRDKGLDVISPLDFDDAGQLAETLHKPYADMYWEVLARDIILVSKLDGIIFLPHWEDSSGANLEALVGLLVSGKKFKFYRWQDDTQTIDPVSRSTLAYQLAAAIIGRGQ